MIWRRIVEKSVLRELENQIISTKLLSGRTVKSIHCHSIKTATASITSG